MPPPHPPGRAVHPEDLGVAQARADAAEHDQQPAEHRDAEEPAVPVGREPPAFPAVPEAVPVDLAVVDRAVRQQVQRVGVEAEHRVRQLLDAQHGHVDELRRPARGGQDSGQEYGERDRDHRPVPPYHAPARPRNALLRRAALAEIDQDVRGVHVSCWAAATHSVTRRATSWPVSPRSARISERLPCGCHACGIPMSRNGTHTPASRSDFASASPKPPVRTPSSTVTTSRCSAAIPTRSTGTGRTHLGSTAVTPYPCSANRAATSTPRWPNGPTTTSRTSARSPRARTSMPATPTRSSAGRSGGTAPVGKRTRVGPSGPVIPARSSTKVTGSRCMATSSSTWSKARLRNVA